MSAGSQGAGNPFATNFNGGGVGLQTAMPDTSSSVTAQAGGYTPWQTPSWVTGGLAQANAPIQNYPITNYGRWDWSNGATNGYGMAAPAPGQWPAPNTITQPGGSPQAPATSGATPVVTSDPYAPKSAPVGGAPTGSPGGWSQGMSPVMQAPNANGKMQQTLNPAFTQQFLNAGNPLQKWNLLSQNVQASGQLGQNQQVLNAFGGQQGWQNFINTYGQGQGAGQPGYQGGS